MSDAVESFLKVVGLGSPFIYAAGAYAFFRLLDERISDEAKKEISDWFKPIKSNPEVVHGAVIEAFDKLYTSKLLSWRAFIRSTLITTTICVVYMVVEFPKRERDIRTYLDPLFFQTDILLPLAFTVFTDYVSLFFVRKWLTIRWQYPARAMVTGTLIGVIVVFFSLVLRFVATAFLILGDSIMRYPSNLLSHLRAMIAYFEYNAIDAIHGWLVIPAIVVHLWLLLFAFGVLVVRLLGPFGLAVEKAQWFFKGGNEHPLQAIGYVAAVTVFLLTAIISILGHALSWPLLRVSSVIWLSSS